MTEQDKTAIRKLQATLAMIANGEKVFFNLTNFREMDLITERNVWGKDCAGNKVIIDTKYGLSEKGNMVLNTIV